MSQVTHQNTEMREDEGKKFSPTVVRRITLGLSLGLFAFSSISVYVQDSARNEEIASYATQISQMQSQKSQTEEQLSGIKAQIDTDVLALNTETVARDSEIIEDILSKALTWDSAESYDSQRLEIINTYKLSADNQFTSVFMPEAKCASDSAGRYCSIDLAGLKSTYQSSRISVSEIGIGAYTYSVEYTAATDSNDGTASATTRGIMNIKISSIGTIESIWATASSGNVLTNQS